MRPCLLIALLAALSAAPTMAYEALYPRTEAGVVEIKELPARRALAARGSGTYFKSADGVFMKLFRYIDRNQVAMTVPVEADVQENRMRFFAGADAQDRALPDTETVTVTNLPALTVASAGLRGAYTEETFERGRTQVRQWLEQNADRWEAAGEPYAVFWNSPFMPGFLKRSEVHQPLRRRAAP